MVDAKTVFPPVLIKHEYFHEDSSSKLSSSAYAIHILTWFTHSTNLNHYLKKEQTALESQGLSEISLLA